MKDAVHAIADPTFLAQGSMTAGEFATHFGAAAILELKQAPLADRHRA